MRGITGPLSRHRRGGLRARLALGALGSLLLRFGATGLHLAASVVLARSVGVRDYGLYAYVSALVALLVVPATAGLPTLIVRHVAAYTAREQWGLMRGLLRRASQAVLPLALGVMTLAGIVGWLLAGRLDPHALETFWIALLLVPLLSLNALRGATLRGLHHVVLGQVPEQLVAPGLFLALLGVAVLALGREWLDATRAMGLWVTAVAVAFALGTRLLRSRLPPPLSRAVPAHETRAWANAALPLILVGGLQYANQEVGLLMLGAIAGAEAAGVYRVATRGADVVVSVVAALNLALAPTFAQLYATGDMRRLERLASIGTRLGLIASLPVVVSFGVFGSWILGTIFGSDFARGSTALAILGAGQLANAATGPVGLLLNMTGHERDAALGVWWASIVNMVLSALLIPMWGIEGAAVASATSVIARNITLAIRVRHRLGLRPFLV